MATRLQPILQTTSAYFVKDFPTEGLPLNNQRTTIGHSEMCDVQITMQQGFTKASNVHCLIFNEGNRITIMDLNDPSITKVNERTKRKTLLRSGDKIRLGDFEFTVANIDLTTEAFDDETLSKWALLGISGPQKDKRISLPSGSTILGKSKHTTIQIPDDKSASKLHAAIRAGEMSLEVARLSTNKELLVDGEKTDVMSPTPLREGSELQIGQSTHKVLVI